MAQVSKTIAVLALILQSTVLSSLQNILAAHIHSTTRSLQDRQCNADQFYEPITNRCIDCPPKCNRCKLVDDPSTMPPPVCTDCRDAYFVDPRSNCRPCIADCVKCVSVPKCDRCVISFTYDQIKKRCIDPTKKSEDNLILAIIIAVGFISVCAVVFGGTCYCIHRINSKVSAKAKERMDLERKADLLVEGGRPIEILELRSDSYLNKSPSIKSGNHNTMNIAKPILAENLSQTRISKRTKSEVFNDKQLLSSLKTVTNVKAPANHPYMPPPID